MVAGVELADLSGKCPGFPPGLIVDPNQPVAYGYDAYEAVFFENNPAFLVSPASNANVVASFSDEPLFLVTWLTQKQLSGKAAIVRCKRARSVILASPDLVYRFQAQGTLPFLFNSIFKAAGDK